MGIGMLLKGVVGGIVIIAAICITWPLQMIAVDGLYKQFVVHCRTDGQEFTRLYARAADSDQLSLDGYIQLTFTGTKANAGTGSGAAGTAPSPDQVNCLSAVAMKRAANEATGTNKAGTANGVNGAWAFIGDATLFKNDVDLFSEHNEEVQTATLGGVSSAASTLPAAATLTITNAKHKTPIPIVQPYSNISLTVLGAIPVIGVISFLTMASVNFYRNQSMGGSDEIGKNIMWTIGGLIIMVVQMFAAPLVIGFINFAYMASGGANISGGPFQAMETFGEVIQIGFEFSPLLYILSMLGTLGYAGFRSFKDDVRGFVGRSGFM